MKPRYGLWVAVILLCALIAAAIDDGKYLNVALIVIVLLSLYFDKRSRDDRQD